MTELALRSRRQSAPPAVRDDVLVGELVVPGEQPAAERVVRDWLNGYAESPNTHRSYARTLTDWFTWCADSGVDPLEARRPLVDEWKIYLYERGLKPSTVNLRLNALSSFYRYAEDEEHCRRSPLRGVRRAKLPSEGTTAALSREELNAFLAEAGRRGGMQSALMHVLALNGLRASEPLLCDVEDVGTERGHRTLAVTRKGVAGKVAVPMAPPTINAMDTWLEERAQLLGQLGKGTGALFFTFTRGTATPRRLDRRDVFRWVAAIGKAALDGRHVHPHMLRATFVTLSLDAGAPLRDVQDSADHASPVTTRRYDRGRKKNDRHATYVLATYLGGDATS